jgi:Spy/CpxP family protein refolding chaperone
MRRFSFLHIAVVLAACSSSDYDNPRDRRPPMREPRMRDSAPMLVELVPSDDWWRDHEIALPLNLSNEQFVSLDRIADEQRDEIARIQRDLPIATRDLRAALDADPASSADILQASQRIRNIRDSLFDRQTQMLAAERLVLTRQQWATLMDQLQKNRREERMNRQDGGYPRGGRGRGGDGWGRPGGRGRGWPY